MYIDIKNANILITGATGFLGKYVMREVFDFFDSRNVFILSDSYKGRGNTISVNHSTFEKEDFIKAGLTRIDIVLHIGAYSPKKSIDQDKVSENIENIISTKRLLDNLPDIPRLIIFSSSVSVYENCGKCITESSPIQTAHMYGVSKYLCEKMIIEYCKANSINYGIFRIGQLYGEGEEKYDKIVSSFLLKAMKGEEIRIFSDGKEKRNLLYVGDCAKWIIEAIKYLYGNANSIICNLVSKNTISVAELVHIIICVTQSKSNVEVQNRIKGRNDNYSVRRLSDILGKQCDEICIEDAISNMYMYMLEKDND